MLGEQEHQKEKGENTSDTVVKQEGIHSGERKWGRKAYRVIFVKAKLWNFNFLMSAGDF